MLQQTKSRQLIGKASQALSMSKTNQINTPARLTGRGNLFTAISSGSCGDPVLQGLGQEQGREFRALSGNAWLNDVFFYRGDQRDLAGLGRWHLKTGVNIEESDLWIGDSGRIFPPEMLGMHAELQERRERSRAARDLSNLCLTWSLADMRDGISKMEKLFSKSGNPWDRSVFWPRYSYSNSVEPPEMKLALHEVTNSALELLRDHSSCPVVVLVDGPVSQRDLEIYRSFGHERLRFGVRIPTMEGNLLQAYEPETAPPSERLAALEAAKKAGLRVFVAMAPLIGECVEGDLRRTIERVLYLEIDEFYLQARRLYPCCFDNLRRHARRSGVAVLPELNSGTRGLRRVMQQIDDIEWTAEEFGIEERLHFWPARELTQASYLRTLTTDERERHLAKMERWMKRCQDWICGKKVPA